MLDSLRGFARSWPGKVMGTFLLVGVAGFGINNVITDLGSNVVARVGDQEINSRQFIRAYNAQMNQIVQQIGLQPSPEEAISLGIPSMVLQSLAQDAAVTRLANEMDLGVSEQKLSEMLREDPNFHTALGTFDANAFRQILQISGLTEAEYFNEQSNAAKRQQLVLGLFGEIVPPATASALINRYRADTRTIDFFVLNETNIAAPPVPAEEELTDYLNAHQSEFRTVETRKVQMLRLSTADLAATRTISDEAIAAEYERTRSSLTRPERRRLQQAVLNTEQIAAFEAGLAANMPFETLVVENDLALTDLGTVAKTDLTDTILADSAFALPDDGFAIIDGVVGKRVVHVSIVDSGGVPTLEQVRNQITEAIAMNEARNELSRVQDEIEELRAAFRPLTEIAGRYGLALYEADVTASGSELDILPNLVSEDRMRIAQAVFRAEPGALTPAVSLAGNGNLWFDLNSVDPARDQILAEVRDTVAQALADERINTALMAAQAEAVKRIDAGEDFETIAASYNIFPEFSTQFTRFGSEDGSIDPAVAQAAFSGGIDHHGSAISQNGEFIVFQVTDMTPATGELMDNARQSLENEMRIGLYGEFVTALLNQAGLHLNEQVLQQILSPDTGL